MCPSTGQPPYIRRAQARRNQRQHAPSPRKPASNAASRLWMRRLYTFPKDVFPNALHLLTPRMIGFVLPGCGCLIARITVCSIPRPKRLCAAEVFSAVSGSGASIFFEAGARAGVCANSLTAGAPSESDAVSNSAKKEQVSYATIHCRDALRFANGRRILLQSLREGVMFAVLET